MCSKCGNPHECNYTAKEFARVTPKSPEAIIRQDKNEIRKAIKARHE